MQHLQDLWEASVVCRLTCCLTCAARYGFVVYADANVTDVACAGLNGMRMGERVLTVRRATEVCLFCRPIILAMYCFSVCDCPLA